MSIKHYKKQLSAFVNQELSKEERHIIAEHLMLCDACRREHDSIKLGADLSATLMQTDAPNNVWRSIENELEDRGAPHISMIPDRRLFSIRSLGAFATAILAVGILSVVVYRGLFMGDEPQIVQNQTQPGATVSPAANIDSVQPTNVNAQNSNGQTETTNSNANTKTPGTVAGAYWQYESIAGTAKVGTGSELGKLAVGDFLETDARSRARIEVANIGSVEIAPNSRIKLVGTTAEQHRLSLERGQLHAKIAAPPRLFIVDTPSAVAVDLGCEYTLEVDKEGNSKLHVTGGYVALEREGRESIVPAGAMCLTKKGKGLGTPFSAESTPEFQKALTSFDFSNGGSRAVQQIIAEADFYDIISLWHLLSRVSKNDRSTVYEALAKYVAPPAGVTREGILNLDKKMLANWRSEVETAWFE
ncbi:MAG: FecR domain-containing protein [Blastocatellia bacterium]